MKKRIIMLILAMIMLVFAINENIYASSEIWITEHVTQTHTKSEILQKYNDARQKFDYSNSMYEIDPSYQNPYASGKLKEQVIADTLNQINFFRWLYGVSEVGLNQDKMERSQKGAVILATIDTLTHYPTQPSDMSDAFYKEAYAACNAGWTVSGDYYNGNCAYGDKYPAGSIEGFIDELNNISSNSHVGHRLNLLDLRVEKASFGYCNRYTALSMYYNDYYSKGSNTEKFYAYPSAGYFPTKYFNTDEYWSFTVNENVNLEDLTSFKVQFIYNGNVYEQKNYEIEMNNTFVFKMPQELINIFGQKQKMPETKINVKITGLKKTNGDVINYSYNVDFFELNEEKPNKISFVKTTDEGYVGEEKDFPSIKVEPIGTTLDDSRMQFSSNNANVASFSSKGKVICNSVGTAKITVTINGLTASYTLVVKEKNTSNLGDINNDQKIDINDAILVLKHITGKEKLTGSKIEIADVTKDSKVDIQDSIQILKYIVGKIKSF